MTLLARAGCVGLVGVVTLGLALRPMEAREGTSDRTKEQRKAFTGQPTQDADLAFHERKMRVELEAIQAEFDLKKAEVARNDADFRLKRLKGELAILTQLDKPIPIKHPAGISLDEFLKEIKEKTKSPELPNGLAIYIDPVGLQETGNTMASKVSFDLEGMPLRKSLLLTLKQLDLTFDVENRLVTITSIVSEDKPLTKGQ